MTIATRRQAPVGIQRRMVELGRIRFGEKVQPTGNQKRPYPRALDRFRLTSASRDLLEAAREVYGGKPVREWKDAPDRGLWELYTDASELDVVLPPVYAAEDGTPTYPYSQAYELWDGPTCARRCDGVTATVPKGRKGLQTVECLCNPDERACQVVTRVTVMLPRLPGIGTWRLDSRGWTAATYLPGTLEMLSVAATMRRFVPARLRLEHRSTRRRGDDGKIETNRFIVPVLDPGITAGQLVAAIGPDTFNVPAIGPAEKPMLGTTEPPAEAALSREEPSLGAPPPLPVAEPPIEQPGAGEQRQEAREASAATTPSPTDEPAGDAWMRAIHAAARERGLDHEGIKAFAAEKFGWVPDEYSLKDLSPTDRGQLRRAIDALPIQTDADTARDAAFQDVTVGSPPGPGQPVPPEPAAASSPHEQGPASATTAPQAWEAELWSTAKAHGLDGWEAIDEVARLVHDRDPDDLSEADWLVVAAEIATGKYDPAPARPRAGARS